MNEQMTIGDAVECLRDGGRAARAGWHGAGMFLTLQVPDANSKMTQPYVYLTTPSGELIPWTCSQADLLATDWGVVMTRERSAA